MVLNSDRLNLLKSFGIKSLITSLINVFKKIVNFLIKLSQKSFFKTRLYVTTFTISTEL